MGEATPTPWWIAGKKTIRYGVKNPRTLQEGGWIADCTWNNGEANAHRIVTAVNAHDDLVTALRDTLIMVERLKKHCRISDGAGYTEDGRMLKLTDVEIAARGALAKAQGQ